MRNNAISEMQPKAPSENEAQMDALLQNASKT